MDPQVLEWPPLVRAACDGWLGGLMLETAEWHRWPVPQPQMQALRRQALQIRDNNLRLMAHLAHLAHALRNHDVDVILLKGAALNLTLYDQLGLRPMSDLDLLVRPETVMRAMAVLESLGYRRGQELVRHDFFPRYHYEVEYSTNDVHPVRIDLHVRPFRPLRYAQKVPEEALWQHSRRIEVGGATAWVPTDEEQLVHLATHSACHANSRLLWLYDIRRLIDLCGSQLDWGRILEISRQWGLVLPVRQTMRAIENLWGPACPGPVRRALEGEQVDWRGRLCLAQAPHDAGHPIRHVAVSLLTTRGLGFRLGYLSRMLLPGREHIGQIYRRRHPGWLLCGHAWRWLRAAANAVMVRSPLKEMVLRPHRTAHTSMTL